MSLSFCRRACCLETAALKRRKKVRLNSIVLLFSFHRLVSLRSFGFKVLRFRLLFSRLAFRFGVARSACRREYSALALCASRFSSASTLAGAARFAFVCGISSLVKVVGRRSLRWNRNEAITAEQGAAPDRLQLRSSFLLTTLPAAGELVVLLLARGVSSRDTKGQKNFLVIVYLTYEKPRENLGYGEETMILFKTLIYGCIALVAIFGVLWMSDYISSPIPWITVLAGSAIWVYFDARRILGDQNGRAELRSAGLWATLVFVAWGIFFFLYLIDRSSIKRRVAEYNEIPAAYR